jgi:hypothetical protein
VSDFKLKVQASKHQNQSLSNANGTARETNSVGTEQPMPASQIPEGLQTAKGSQQYNQRTLSFIDK